MSPAASPADLGANTDPRQLGLPVAELRAGGGRDVRPVALDDPLSSAGLHAAEAEAA